MRDIMLRMAEKKHKRYGSPTADSCGRAVFRAFLEAASRPALPSAARMVPPPATNENVRKSMQGNKRCNTKPELLVRQRLRQAGLDGYRLQWKVPGRPDVAWPGKKTALFINGCFWHRCPLCKPRMPKSNVEYWVVKFERNVERDERSLAQLEEMGWTVHVIWECQLKKKTIEATMADLLPQLAKELGKELKGTAPPPPTDARDRDV